MENVNLPSKNDKKELKPESSKMKIFQMSQKYFTILGISPNLIVQPYPFNRRISIGFLMLGLVLICNYVFIIYGAKTFLDFSQSIYIGSALAVGSLALAVLVFRVKILFEFIVNFENAINTSKWTPKPNCIRYY